MASTNSDWKNVLDSLGCESLLNGPSKRLSAILEKAESGEVLDREEALYLVSIEKDEIPYLLQTASKLRDSGKGNILTYSKNVFVPVTQTCRNQCGYCTFKYEPGEGPLFMSPEEVVDLAKKGAELGCTELLFVTGDKHTTKLLTQE